jgi:hypothetical protein
MKGLRKCVLLAVSLCAGAMLVATGPAFANGGGDSGDQHGTKPFGEVPPRVAVKLRRALRAVDRASDYIDDGEDAKAARNLRAARRNFDTAVSRTVRYIGRPSDRAPAAARAVVIAADRMIEHTLADLDVAGEGLSNALTETIDAAVSGRRAVVDAIAGSVGGMTAKNGDHQDQPSGASAYSTILQRVVHDCGSELTDLGDSLAEDRLTGDARGALEAASDAISKTKDAATAALNAATGADSGDETQPGEPDEDPPA